MNTKTSLKWCGKLTNKITSSNVYFPKCTFRGKHIFLGFWLSTFPLFPQMAGEKGRVLEASYTYCWTRNFISVIYQLMGKKQSMETNTVLIIPSGIKLIERIQEWIEYLLTFILGALTFFLEGGGCEHTCSLNFLIFLFWLLYGIQSNTGVLTGKHFTAPLVHFDLVLFTNVFSFVTFYPLPILLPYAGNHVNSRCTFTVQFSGPVTRIWGNSLFFDTSICSVCLHKKQLLKHVNNVTSCSPKVYPVFS